MQILIYCKRAGCSYRIVQSEYFRLICYNRKQEMRSIDSLIYNITPSIRID